MKMPPFLVDIPEVMQPMCCTEGGD